MSNKCNKDIQIRLDIFPEVYNSGLTVNELIDTLAEARELNGDDKLLLLSGNCLKTVTIATLQQAIGGSENPGGDGVIDNNVYAVISE